VGEDSSWMNLSVCEEIHLKLDRTREISTPPWWTEDRIKEVTWLATQASKCQRIVEVGSWTGGSARPMADNTEATIFCVDNWWTGVAGMDGLWALNEFLKNTSDLKNIRLLRMDSLEAAYLLRHERFDMIFIDAAHDYESVCQDISAWQPLVRPGGILCGHDYNSDWPGVMKAVDEWIKNRVIVAGAIWSNRQGFDTI
jgi:predicted O-methyltransferase YrrM